MAKLVKEKKVVEEDKVSAAAAAVRNYTATDVDPMLRTSVAKFSASLGKPESALLAEILEVANKNGYKTLAAAKSVVFNKYRTQVLDSDVVVKGAYISYRQLDEQNILLKFLTESGEFAFLRGVLSDIPEGFNNVLPLDSWKVSGVQKVTQKLRSSTETRLFIGSNAIFEPAPKLDVSKYKIALSTVTEDMSKPPRHSIVIAGKVANVWAASRWIKESKRFGDKLPILVSDSKTNELVPNFQLVIDDDSGATASVNVNNVCWRDNSKLTLTGLSDIVQSYSKPEEQARDLSETLQDESVIAIGVVSSVFSSKRDGAKVVKLFLDVLDFVDTGVVQAAKVAHATSAPADIAADISAAADSDVDLTQEEQLVLSSISSMLARSADVVELITKHPVLAVSLPGILKSLIDKGVIYKSPDTGKYVAAPA